MEKTLLKVVGLVKQSLELTFSDLQSLQEDYQVADVGQIVAGRRGTAVTLAGILSITGVKQDAKYVQLYSSSDDFHASVPLDEVIDTAFLVYADQGEPLSKAAGGPVRFIVPNAAECNTAEVDTCANVKFVDKIELTSEKKA
jgi:DMSO/TMAO reductase YedYZ molybdopterin-dependent catalytic subunit